MAGSGALYWSALSVRWIIKCLRRYADFRGRAGLAECSTFLLFFLLCCCLAFGLDLIMGWGVENVVPWTLWYPTFEITRMALILPALAVTARRLHDLGRSGWLALLWAVPILGWAYLLMVIVQSSDARGHSLDQGLK